MNAPNEIPAAPPAPVVDPAGSRAQMVPHREWNNTDAKKLLRALVRIGAVHRDGPNEALDGVHLRAGNAMATDGHRLLCVIDYCKAEHLQGHTYHTLGSGFGLFADAVTGQEFAEWESLVPKLSAVKHSLRIAWRSIPRVSDYTPVSIHADGIALGMDPAAIVTVDLRYLCALPRTDEALRILVVDHISPVFVYEELGGWFAILMPVDAGKEKENLVIPFALEVGHGA
jgi:hypothetical protein